MFLVHDLTKLIYFLRFGFKIFSDILIRVMVVMIKHHNPKQVWKERVYLTYTSTSFFVIHGSQGRHSNRNPGAGADSKAVKASQLLAWSLLFVQPDFLQNPQPPDQ